MSNQIYKCQWCEKEKKPDKYYKRSITNKTFICKECIDRKFEELVLKYDTDRAIFIVCHYLNLPFYRQCVESLKEEKGDIGYYIRQLNLNQNKHHLDDFETSIIKNNNLEFSPPDYKYTETKHRLGDIIKEIEQLRDLF